MGYAHNHLATIVTGAFALVLTGIWPPMVDYAPNLNFIFIMAIYYRSFPAIRFISLYSIFRNAEVC